MAGEPAAEAGADLAERQVDLVVQDEDVVEARRGARRAPGRPSGRRRSCRSAASGSRPASWSTRAADPALGEQAAVTSTSACAGPSASQALGDLEADVVRGAGVLGAGVAEPDDQPVDARSAATRQRHPAPTRRRRRRRPPASSPSASAPSSPSPTTSVSASISSSSSTCSRGGLSVATTVSGSPMIVDAGRRVERPERQRVADLHAGDVVLDRVGDVGRQRLDRDLAERLLEHAALLDAGRVVDAGQLERSRSPGS